MTARFFVVYVAFLAFMILLGVYGGIIVGDYIIASTNPTLER